MIKLAIAILVSIASGLMDLLVALFAMWWLDAANHFDDRVPAFGYWTCFFLLWALCCPVSSVLFAREIRKSVEEDYA